jgi:hypothetical protein
MAKSFLPDKDAALLAWSLNFSTKISETPVLFGLTPALATAYALLHASYADALADCAPGERSKTLVSRKNSDRTSLKASARLLAKLVEGTATVSDAQKIELGLTVRQQPTPIPPPAAAPALDVVSVLGRTVKIRLHDATDAARRGKPAGVDGAAVLSYVGATPPADLGQWRFEGNTTRTTLDVVFPNSVAPGAPVWLTALWFNERKQAGPNCAPVGTNVQFGSGSAAA